MTSILMIEDDRDFAQLLRGALENEEDLEVIEVLDCEKKAEDYLSGSGLESIDTVLLDLQLPYESDDRSASTLAGLRLLKKIREEIRYYGTVIVLTSSRSAADGQRALAAGCDGYLCKRAKISEIPELVTELKMAIRGDVILVASQMRHVFMREDISAKEARMLDLLCMGKSWTEIAGELSYKTSKAAANIGDRVFDKLLTPEDHTRVKQQGLKKRQVALEIWLSRRQASITSE